jgi:hypothetical protein
MEKNSGYVTDMKVVAVLLVVFVTLIGDFAITKETMVPAQPNSIFPCQERIVKNSGHACI